MPLICLTEAWLSEKEEAGRLSDWESQPCLAGGEGEGHQQSSIKSWDLEDHMWQTDSAPHVLLILWSLRLSGEIFMLQKCVLWCFVWKQVDARRLGFTSGGVTHHHRWTRWTIQSPNDWLFFSTHHVEISVVIDRCQIVRGDYQPNDLALFVSVDPLSSCTLKSESKQRLNLHIWFYLFILFYL